MTGPALRLVAPRRLWPALLLLTLPGLVGAGEAPPAEQELAQVEQAISRIESWLAQAQQNRPELEQRLAEAEERLADLSQAVALTRGSIAASEAQLASLQQRRRPLEADKQQQLSVIRQLLRAAYREGADGAIKLVLNQQDPAQAGRLLHYYRLLNQQRLDRLRDFEQILASLAGTEQELLLTQQQLDGEQRQLGEQLNRLESERQAREQALAELDAAIRQRGSAREDLLAERAALQELIEEVQRAAQQLPRPGSQQPFAGRKGSLAWPGDGPLLTRFGERYGNGELQRQGITIAREPGDAVSAVHDGRVVFANWLRGYGLLVILDHGEGYLSLYGQNESLATAQGARVAAGERIASAGDSGGREQTGTYFEIRYNGVPQDPMDWLEAAD